VCLASPVIFTCDWSTGKNILIVWPAIGQPGRIFPCSGPGYCWARRGRCAWLRPSSLPAHAHTHKNLHIHVRIIQIHIIHIHIHMQGKCSGPEYCWTRSGGCAWLRPSSLRAHANIHKYTYTHTHVHNNIHINIIQDAGESEGEVSLAAAVIFTCIHTYT
jgi:hypothetical protein